MRKWWSGFSREYQLLLLSWLFIGVTSGLYDPTFNNYLNEIFHVSAKVRGFLEFPRELPGFLVAIVSGLLMFIADVPILGMAFGLIALGLIGQSFAVWHGGPQFSWMITSMLVWSLGTHLFLPLSSSVSVKLSKEGEIGKSLGRLNGINNAAYIVGCASIWLLLGYWKIGYNWIFRVAAVFSLLAAVCLFLMKKPPRSKATRFKFRLLFRKEYSLFYWLSVLYGARKQVFLTFAPWVLIKVYHQPATTIAGLLFAAATIGIVFKPWVGRMIDRIGERFILMADAFSLIFVCLGYGFAGHLGLGGFAVWLVFLCFILDQLLFAVTIARTTYLHKRLVEESDLTPTLSMGVSMDHLVAMTVPVLGGLLWEAMGFEAIFVVAALISGVNLLVAGKIQTGIAQKL